MVIVEVVVVVLVVVEDVSVVLLPLIGGHNTERPMALDTSSTTVSISVPSILER